MQTTTNFMRRTLIEWKENGSDTFSYLSSADYNLQLSTRLGTESNNELYLLIVLRVKFKVHGQSGHHHKTFRLVFQADMFDFDNDEPSLSIRSLENSNPRSSTINALKRAILASDPINPAICCLRFRLRSCGNVYIPNAEGVPLMPISKKSLDALCALRSLSKTKEFVAYIVAGNGYLELLEDLCRRVSGRQMLNNTCDFTICHDHKAGSVCNDWSNITMAGYVSGPTVPQQTVSFSFSFTDDVDPISAAGHGSPLRTKQPRGTTSQGNKAVPLIKTDPLPAVGHDSPLRTKQPRGTTSQDNKAIPLIKTEPLPAVRNDYLDYILHAEQQRGTTSQDNKAVPLIKTDPLPAVRNDYLDYILHAEQQRGTTSQDNKAVPLIKTGPLPPVKHDYLDYLIHAEQQRGKTSQDNKAVPLIKTDPLPASTVDPLPAVGLACTEQRQDKTPQHSKAVPSINNDPLPAVGIGSPFHTEHRQGMTPQHSKAVPSINNDPLPAVGIGSPFRTEHRQGKTPQHSKAVPSINNDFNYVDDQEDEWQRLVGNDESDRGYSMGSVMYMMEGQRGQQPGPLEELDEEPQEIQVQRKRKSSSITTDHVEYNNEDIDASGSENPTHRKRVRFSNNVRVKEIPFCHSFYQNEVVILMQWLHIHNPSWPNKYFPQLTRLGYAANRGDEALFLFTKFELIAEVLIASGGDCDPVPSQEHHEHDV